MKCKNSYQESISNIYGKCRTINNTRQLNVAQELLLLLLAAAALKAHQVLLLLLLPSVLFSASLCFPIRSLALHSYPAAVVVVVIIVAAADGHLVDCDLRSIGMIFLLLVAILMMI